MKWLIILLLIVKAKFGNAQTECEERCQRLKQRSLNRIGYDDQERLDQLFERQRPLMSLKDVCWRLYDNLDCMKKCRRSKEHSDFAKLVRNKCRFVLQDIEATLKCVSKHHSFLATRCSSFLNEATHLRSESDLTQTPQHEECRFLHLNSICLENHVNSFCENARTIFRRLNFRDYFLSFIVPNEDGLFDDEDLDACQIFNFVKDSQQHQFDEQERQREEERRKKIERLTEEDEEEEEEDDLTTIANLIEDNVVNRKSNGTIDEGNQIVNNTEGSISSGSDQGLPETTETPEEQQISLSATGPEFSTAEEDDEVETPPGNRVNTDGRTTSDHEETTTQTDDELTTILKDLIDREYDDDYDEEPLEGDEQEEDGKVNVVSIETRAPVQTSTQPSDDLDLTTFAIRLTPPDNHKPKVETTTRRKLFSDDSMEQTPPNFFYSSLRYETSTRSNYVAEHFDIKEEVEPLEIDTTTLFGEENEGKENKYEEEDEAEIEKNDEKMEEPIEPMHPLAPVNKKLERKPLINGGGIIIKPILDFNQPDMDEDEQREQQHRKEMERLLEQRRLEKQLESNDILDDPLTDISNEISTIEPSENRNNLETWLVIGLIGFVIILFALLLASYLFAESTENETMRHSESAPIKSFA